MSDEVKPIILIGGVVIDPELKKRRDYGLDQG